MILPTNLFPKEGGRGHHGWNLQKLPQNIIQHAVHSWRFIEWISWFHITGGTDKKWKTKLIRLKSRLPPPPSQAINNETDRSLSTFEVKCTIFFMYRFVKEKLVKIKERQIIPISVSSFLHSSKKFSNVINYRQPDLSSKR